MKIKKSEATKEECTAKAAQSPGRPRAFDVDEALEKALEVFRRQGYEGTSISDLTEAIGVNRPSLYAAFGNKEALFHKALDRYAEGSSAFINEALSQPTSRAVAEHFLMGAVGVLNSDCPRGCLLVKGALACSDDSSAIQEELTRRRAQGEATLKKRFDKAKKAGDLPPNANSADLARYITTVLHGLSVQAIGGATAKELKNVVALALKAWPSP